MFEKMQTGRAQPLSEDDERTIGFVRFIDARGFSADQIREAYYRLCGISETGNDDPAIEEIRERMQTMTDKKFSLNRFCVSHRSKTGVRGCQVILLQLHQRPSCLG